MFKTTVTPRFGDMDGLRHINNTVLPVWFEQSRNPIFRIFTPDLNPAKWKLIMVRTEFDFVDELFYGIDVEIKTYVLNIGNTSFTVGHEAWQYGKLRAKGKAIMVHYDFGLKKSIQIPDSIRESLKEHLYPEE